MKQERMKCYGCVHHYERSEGDGGRTYLCKRTPGLIVGSVNLAEWGEPYEANFCHSRRG